MGKDCHIPNNLFEQKPQKPMNTPKGRKEISFRKESSRDLSEKSHCISEDKDYEEMPLLKINAICKIKPAKNGTLGKTSAVFSV